MFLCVKKSCEVSTRFIFWERIFVFCLAKNRQVRVLNKIHTKMYGEFFVSFFRFVSVSFLFFFRVVLVLFFVSSPSPPSVQPLPLSVWVCQKKFFLTVTQIFFSLSLCLLFLCV